MSLSAKIKRTGLIGSSDRYLTIEVTPSNAPAGYPTNGDTLDLSTLVNDKNLIGGYLTVLPQKEDVTFQDSLAGNQADWVPGTTLKNGLMKLWASQGTEHANGNYSAAELADTIEITFACKKSH